MPEVLPMLASEALVDCAGFGRTFVFRHSERRAVPIAN